MKAYQIRLSIAENAKRFVNIVNRYPYEVDLCEGRYVIDGRSAAGVLSLRLYKHLTMVILDDHCEDLVTELQPYIVG